MRRNLRLRVDTECKRHHWIGTTFHRISNCARLMRRKHARCVYKSSDERPAEEQYNFARCWELFWCSCSKRNITGLGVSRLFCLRCAHNSLGGVKPCKKAIASSFSATLSTPRLLCRLTMLEMLQKILMSHFCLSQNAT